MKNVGDYQWQQLSMWEFAPEKCVEKFVSSDGHIFHYYLRKVIEVTSPNSWRLETVTALDGVPDEILALKDGDSIKVKS